METHDPILLPPSAPPAAARGATATSWTRADWRNLALVGLLGGVFLTGWGYVSQYLMIDRHVGDALLGLSYFGWFLPGLLAAALIRKPGAFLLGETLAGCGEFLFIALFIREAPITTCSFAGVDLYVLSGLIQGLGGELALVALRYAAWNPLTLAAAGVGCWWAGWLKGVHHTHCYSWSEPDLLLTATLSAAVVGALVGRLAARREISE